MERLNQGLQRDEHYLPYFCTLLDVGARHECPGQIKTWYHLLKDSLGHCSLHDHTESSLRVRHTSGPYREADWITIGNKDVADCGWSLTPWHFLKPLPLLTLCQVWVEITKAYGEHHQLRLSHSLTTDPKGRATARSPPLLAGTGA